MIWFVSAALSAGAATAQIPTSTQDRVTTPIPPRRSEIARTDEIMRDMAACVIRRQPGRTRTLLDTVPGSHEEGRILTSFQSRMNSCYDDSRNSGRSMGLTLNLLRAAIAEHYYQRDFAGSFAPVTGVSPEKAEAWTQPRPIGNRIGQLEAVHSMARCVTVRQPMAVHALLAVPPLSPAEGRAFARLRAELAACLIDGVELTASRQSLRGLLAEAAFHYAGARATGLERLAGQAVASPPQ